MLPIKQTVHLGYWLKKQPLLWRAAVAFLMFMFLISLSGVGQCDDDTDERHYNADKTYDCF